MTQTHAKTGVEKLGQQPRLTPKKSVDDRDSRNLKKFKKKLAGIYSVVLAIDHHRALDVNLLISI